MPGAGIIHQKKKSTPLHTKVRRGAFAGSLFAGVLIPPFLFNPCKYSIMSPATIFLYPLTILHNGSLFLPQSFVCNGFDLYPSRAACRVVGQTHENTFHVHADMDRWGLSFMLPQISSHPPLPLLSRAGKIADSRQRVKSLL